MMKSKSNRSIQKILLSTYLNLMLVILLSVSFVFTAMEYVTMRKNTTESLQQICDTISQDVENQLELMNITSVNVLYSTLPAIFPGAVPWMVRKRFTPNPP